MNNSKSLQITTSKTLVIAFLLWVFILPLAVSLQTTETMARVTNARQLGELGANARIEETIARNAEGVYEAKVFAKGPDGIEISKSGNSGKSTFFPDSWDEARILDEVEYAVKNNKGFANGLDAKDGYYGFSKNGKIKIEFYYDDATGKINSFSPSLRP